MANGKASEAAEIGRRDLFVASAAAAGLVATVGAGRPTLAQPAEAPAAQPATAQPGNVLLERRGNLLLIGINRPWARNLLDPQILIGLGKAFYQLDHDAALRVAVMHGIGNDFCVGVDVLALVKAQAAGQFPPKEPDFIGPLGFQLPYRSKPVVVAVQGATMLGGHELFLSADVRVAASDTVFRQHEVTRGGFPSGGATVRFPREAGGGNAMRYMLTGDQWDAEEARRLAWFRRSFRPAGNSIAPSCWRRRLLQRRRWGCRPRWHRLVRRLPPRRQPLTRPWRRFAPGWCRARTHRKAAARCRKGVLRCSAANSGEGGHGMRFRALRAALMVMLVGSLTEPKQTSAQTLVTHRLPAALAMEAVAAAVSACSQKGYGVTATVIDADAERIAMLRGDTAGVHTFEASWGKAYRAVGFAPIFKVNSGGEVAERLARYAARQPPGTLPFQPPEHMIFRAGGLTIKLGDEVIGAIGVGGAPSAEADEACARDGLDKIRDGIR